MKLSIIIPSYRRAKYLKALVNSLKPMVSGYPNIEVIVIIDPSGDNSVDAVAGSGFNWIINDIRIGLNESIIKGINGARGDYIWILGDDDMVCPGGIERILSHIIFADPSMIVATDGDKDFSDVVQPSYFIYVDYIRMALKRRPSLLVEDLTISSRIFSRTMFSDSISRKYEHTQFGHYYSVSHRMFRYGGIIILDTSGKIFKRLPQRDRPLWVDFPTNLDRLYLDYLKFIEERSGVTIDPDIVLSEGRQAFRKSLRNPVTFLINNRRAVFNIRAWKYAFNRLFNHRKS